MYVCWVCQCNKRAAWSEGQMRHRGEAATTRGDRSDRVCQGGGRGGGVRSKRSPNGSLQQWRGRQDRGEVCHT